MWMELGERDIRALGEASGTPERVIRGAPEPRPKPQDQRAAPAAAAAGAAARALTSPATLQDDAPRPFAGSPRRRSGMAAGRAAVRWWQRSPIR